MLKKIALIALCSMSAFALKSVELNINNEDLEVVTRFDVSNFNNNIESNTVLVGIGVLNADKSNSDDVNTSLDPLAEFSFLMRREINNNGIYVGLGMKANATKNADDNFISVPMGFEVDYKIPIFYNMPMYIGVSVYYAPSSLSFGEADNFLERRIHYDIEVIENAIITFGYRSIDTNYKEYDFNYNQSAYAGLGFTF
jgi:hypothetical protein